MAIDEMNTVLVEIELTRNNRPLTYIYDDVEGVSYVLTPADLIHATNNPKWTTIEVTSFDKEIALSVFLI